VNGESGKMTEFLTFRFSFFTFFLPFFAFRFILLEISKSGRFIARELILFEVLKFDLDNSWIKVCALQTVVAGSRN